MNNRFYDDITFPDGTKLIIVDVHKREQLNKCNAQILTCTCIINGVMHENIRVLQSYQTIVAFEFYSYVFIRNYYSNTTTQHCYKFVKICDADIIIYCYKRSDDIISRNLITGTTIKGKDVDKKW